MEKKSEYIIFRLVYAGDSEKFDQEDVHYNFGVRSDLLYDKEVVTQAALIAYEALLEEICPSQRDLH